VRASSAVGCGQRFGLTAKRTQSLTEIGHGLSRNPLAGHPVGLRVSERLSATLRIERLAANRRRGVFHLFSSAKAALRQRG